MEVAYIRFLGIVCLRGVVVVGVHGGWRTHHHGRKDIVIVFGIEHVRVARVVLFLDLRRVSP
jgi:hypothetical protein